MNDGDDDDEEDLVEARKALKEQEANKTKAGDAWSLLTGLTGGSSGSGRGGGSKGASDKRQKTGASDASTVKAANGATSTDLDALCRSIAKKKKEQAKNKGCDTSWMRQMGIVGRTAAATKSKSKTTTKTNTAEEIAAEAMSAVKEATASSVLANASGMITIAETRRFAGKNITVEREVAKGSRDAKLAAANPVGRKKAGLDAVLDQIAPAKKVTVMDKSKSDWKEFKTNDDQVLEELEAHKKSGATYIEKKDFLLAADVKQYEKERDARLGSDVRNRGRL